MNIPRAPRAALPLLLLLIALGGGGCVDQNPAGPLLAEDGAAAYRLMATSRATVEICDRLGLELAGVPSLAGLPARYADVPRIGASMSPDMEQIKLLAPTEIAGPDTLAESLSPGYENAGLPATFLNLRSVRGLYESADYLGGKYGAAEEARALRQEYEDRLAQLRLKQDGRPAPRVLILMGLPGAYIEGTPNSYIGDLVELCGGVNVVTDPAESFVNWNTEELLLLDPDIILCAAHALPDLVKEMFAREFMENDIWKHFRAVQEGRVYDLDYEIFSMSANFLWPEALDQLEDLFYEESAA